MSDIPESKERFDYLAPWEEEWLADESEFVLDSPEYWDDYRNAVMELQNQEDCGARSTEEGSK